MYFEQKCVLNKYYLSRERETVRGRESERDGENERVKEMERIRV